MYQRVETLCGAKISFCDQKKKRHKSGILLSVISSNNENWNSTTAQCCHTGQLPDDYFKSIFDHF